MDKYDCLKIENQLCFPLYACAKEVVRKYTPLLERLDLTYTQYIAMMVMWDRKEISVKELGEKLFLDHDLESFAQEEQREAMEQDDREGIVREYLDMLLPENWDSMDMYRRREYFRDQDDPTRPKGSITRTEVTNLEIWCECFGKSKEDIQPKDSYAIAAIMKRIKEWEKTDVRRRVPGYGLQRVYMRKEV